MDPIRGLRIPDDVWSGSMKRAQDEGLSLSEVIRGWLVDYSAGRRRVGPNKPVAVELSRAELGRLRDLIDGLLK